jgi:AcrR family transcriptional regulator
MIEKSVPKISKKQKQIVETAETLFVRHGIKRITVEEICREAGVSKMTFYKYFPNKIELVKHIWKNWIEEGYAKLNEINEIDIAFPEKLELMFKWKEEFISKIDIEFIEELLRIDVELEEFTNRFMQFIVEAQKRGDIRPEIRPEFLMAVLEKLNELARNDDLRKKYPTYIDFQRELKDFFWLGVLARPESGSK